MDQKQTLIFIFNVFLPSPGIYVNSSKNSPSFPQSVPKAAVGQDFRLYSSAIMWGGGEWGWGGQCQSPLPVNNLKFWLNLGVIEREPPFSRGQEEIVLSLESQTPLWTDVSWPLSLFLPSPPHLLFHYGGRAGGGWWYKGFLSPVRQPFVGIKPTPVRFFTVWSM